MSLEKNISRLLSRKDEIEERLSSSSLDTADLMHLSKELSDLRPIAEQAAKVQKLKWNLVTLKIW
jgi:protein subunit release factor A